MMLRLWRWCWELRLRMAGWTFIVVSYGYEGRTIRLYQRPGYDGGPRLHFYEACRAQIYADFERPLRQQGLWL